MKNVKNHKHILSHGTVKCMKCNKVIAKCPCCNNTIIYAWCLDCFDKIHLKGK